jgi:hypothetical protein
MVERLKSAGAVSGRLYWSCQKELCPMSRADPQFADPQFDKGLGIEVKLEQGMDLGKDLEASRGDQS